MNNLMKESVIKATNLFKFKGEKINAGDCFYGQYFFNYG